MKIAIMTDLEGPAGVNGRSDGLGNQIVNTPTACQMLVEEINACVRGLLRGGADEIIVWDGHGSSNSIDASKLLPPVQLGTIGGDLAPGVFVDASFDAQVCIGYHTMGGVTDGYLNHSFDSHNVCGMWINGEPIGEIGIGAYEAAYFGVPTILVTGDRAACREAKAFLPDVETVCTKRALSRYTVVNRHPEDVRREIEETAARALGKLGDFKVKTIPAELEFKVQHMCPNIADSYEKIGWERLDTLTVATRGTDFIDVYSRRLGWAAGVHNRRFGITPDWRG